VDERFFAFTAHEYIKSSPPRRVCLHEYGAEFPDFLGGFPPCRHLAYLPDVARLEHQINAALHSPAEDALGTDAFLDVTLGDYPRLVFRLLPSLRYLESPWPVDRIWLGQQEGRETAVDLGEGGCRLEIRQRGEEVVFCRLGALQFTLRHALLAATRWRAQPRPRWPSIRCGTWPWRFGGSWPKGSSPAFPSLPSIQSRRYLP
jgi:hypothetical protein